MTSLTQIVNMLDRELNAGAFDDSSHNGLQVENRGKVSKVCCGVDASLEFFEEAHGLGADLVLCHHGLSWGDSLARITDLNYRRVRYLIEHGMALYASHLPLDAHPKYGNNIQIAKLLKLQKLKPFGNHRGMMLGFAGALPKPMRMSTLAKHVEMLMGQPVQEMAYGRKLIRTVGVVSGGAASDMVQIADAGVDLFLSGEPTLAACIEARDRGLNGLFAGHYATEKWGVMALGKLLESKFKLPWEFVDLGITF
jgi:dinuclear metal center YbgI/SA1388 family protein